MLFCGQLSRAHCHWPQIPEFDPHPNRKASWQHLPRSTMAPPPPSTFSSVKNIVFFHPDLGIGGAERLVIDAAVGLQDLGHKVTIFTSYRDKNHCFDEAKDGEFTRNTSQ